jgi:hypothetical protein
MFGLGEFRKDGIIDLPSDPRYDERKVSAWDILSQAGVRVAYNIRGLGQLVASWDGGTGTLSRYSPTSVTRNIFGFDGQFINAHLNLTAVRNLQASFGIEIPLPINKYYRGIDVSRRGIWSPDELEERNGKFSRQFPFGIDIRAVYTSGNFSIGSGIAVYLGGHLEAEWEQVKAEGGRILDPHEIGISLNPMYRFSNFNAGIVGELKIVEFIHSNILTHPFTFTGLHADRGPWITFNIIPYVSTKITSGGSAWAGLQIRGQPYAGFKHDDGKSWKYLFMWSVPIGIAYVF